MNSAFPPFKWSNYEWAHGQRWGDIHPDNTRQWYDPMAVVKNRDKSLSLLTRYNPKYFEDLKVTSPIGVGLVNCTTEFDYGYFEIEAMMPKGKNLWPAFWMGSWSTWPPEIDILEAYTNSQGNYFHFDWTTPFAFLNVKTNIHYKDENNEYSTSGGKAHWFTFKNLTKNYIKYSCLFSPLEISFFYNERCVRSITNPNILKRFQGHKMNALLNNAVDHNAVLDGSHKESEFRIKYFKYTQL